MIVIVIVNYKLEACNRAEVAKQRKEARDGTDFLVYKVTWTVNIVDALFSLRSV